MEGDVFEKSEKSMYDGIGSEKDKDRSPCTEYCWHTPLVEVNQAVFSIVI